MSLNDPVLVVMAAGMGSRYGGLKQLEPLGPTGEILMDYSVYDAIKAGFAEVIFVIRKDFEKEFDDKIGSKWKDRIPCRYAFQELDRLPDGHKLPQGRIKPWGTGQAVLAAGDFIQGPFAVINADDFYGPEAYRVMQAFLTRGRQEESLSLGLGVWHLGDTLSDHGSVSRGLCQIGEEGFLLGIEEIKEIERTPEGARYRLDPGEEYRQISADHPVSMNFWGLTAPYLDKLEEGFLEFLEREAVKNPLTSEYLLPTAIGRHLEEGRVTVQTMPAGGIWYGVTHREDKPLVQKALAGLVEQGLYPSPLH